MPYNEDMSSPRNPIYAGMSTEHAAAAVVLASLAALILIARGFRGVNLGGVGVSVR